jgi:large subunit ribosomal protein L18
MTAIKLLQRERRHNRIRQKVSGVEAKPRLSVFRSNKAIYAQLVDDTKGKTLASASSLTLKGKKGVEAAKLVGQELAKLAKEKKIAVCVFDRSGYLYHGQVKALAEGAREGGLQF